MTRKPPHQLRLDELHARADLLAWRNAATSPSEGRPHRESSRNPKDSARPPHPGTGRPTESNRAGVALPSDRAGSQGLPQQDTRCPNNRRTRWNKATASLASCSISLHSRVAQPPERPLLVALSRSQAVSEVLP